MISRRSFVTLFAGAALAVNFNTAFAAEQVQSITAITEVLGNGQILSAVAIEYDAVIDNSKLVASNFNVASRTITAIYANTEANRAKQGVNGHFVILELSAEDAEASLYVKAKRSATRKEAKVTVTQLSAIATTQAGAVEGFAASANTAIRNLVHEDFTPAEFKSAAEETLKYNLFVPKNYDKAKSYPLVLFMHDAGVTSDIVDMTLVQGNGAIIFASPDEQAKNEAFVLAPQFSRAIVNDQSETTSDLDMVIDLIKQLSADYSIDQNRLYTTGQSGGGMMSIAMNIKYPDFFAASYLVACQWDAALVAPLASDKLWIVVSEGDEKAFPGQNAITAELEKLGAKVSRAQWEGTYSPEQFEQAVTAMNVDGKAIRYVTLKKGTVVPVGEDDNAGGNHVNTWRIAYSVPGIRDWLFQQSK